MVPISRRRAFWPEPSRWKSLAQIKTEKGPDSWSMQVRIPTVGREEETIPQFQTSNLIPIHD